MNKEETSCATPQEKIAALAETLIGKLTAAAEEISPADLIADRNALKLITGALRDLRELSESAAEAHGGSQAPQAPALTVAFLGGTEEMCE